jgi:Domain of unknown function (DUF4386)
MNHPQTIARVTGVLFLLTYITAIPQYIILYAPVLADPNYIVGVGRDTLIIANFLELLLIIATIGTAVVLFPLLRRQNEILALGYVTARIVECVFIAVGILSLLTVVALRQEAAGADPGSLVLVGSALVALHDPGSFLLGAGFFVGVGNGLILGYLMYTSRLIPRYLAVLGLIAGPLLIVSGVALFGVFEAGSVWQGIVTIPLFIWNLALGIWLTVRGFNPSAVARLQNVSQ